MLPLCHSSQASLDPPKKNNGIDWSPCNASVADPALLCGFFQIPLDYHNASAGYGKLAVIKANATGTHRGSVFVNFGGPGVSGLQDLDRNKSALLLNQTGGDYDIISWDPRGVGISEPGDTRCFASAEEEAAFFNGTIELHGIEMTGNFTNPEDLNALRSQASIMQEKYTALSQKCLDINGDNLKYIGTTATARDLAALSDAIDGPGNPVNYIGLSYGTVLGEHFMGLFPERVGHFILDGVVDPRGIATLDVSLNWGQQLVDADSVYNAFFTGCALAGPESCGIASSNDSSLDVNTKIQLLLKDGRDVWFANMSAPVTSGVIRSAIRDVMYSPVSWAGFSNTSLPQLAAAVASEAQVSGAIPSSRRKRDENDSPIYSPTAIICADSVDTSSNISDVFDSIISTARDISPMFSAAWPFTTYYCSTWTARAVERYTGPFNKTLANRILVIGNTFDNATPFAGAQNVTALHSDQASLIRMNGVGHTSQAGRSKCIDDIIRSYMLDGSLPDGDDTVCEMDGDFELWLGVNTKMILSNMPSGLF